MKSIYEQLGGTYSRVGDYYLPNMDIGPAETPNSARQAKKEEPFSKEEAISRPETDTGWIGKYGMMRKSYLKEHRPVLYAELIRIGKLHEHLAKVNETCSRQVDEYGDRFQEIEVYLNFIGRFEVPTPEPTPEELAQMEAERKKRAANREKYYRRKERKAKQAAEAAVAVLAETEATAKTE